MSAIDADSFKLAIAIFEDKKFVNNVLIFGGKKSDADTRARNIYNYFCEFLDEYKPDEVVIERSVYLQSFPATRSISEIIGLCKLACGQRNIPYNLVHNTAWKKRILGNGRVTKDEILRFVKDKYNPNYNITQDEADSILIGEYFLSLKRGKK